MFCERDFEDIISKYPELIEDGLVLKGRQVTVYGRRMDLLFEDRFKRKLIVELKKGPIKDDHIGQVMSYEGMLLSADDPTIRIMLIGNRVPPNIQRTLDHHGIAWREISCTRLSEFLAEKDDQELMGVLDNSEENQFSGNLRYKVKQAPFPLPKKVLTPDEIISVMKETEEYQSFNSVLAQKKDNEEKAKNIILQNLGYLSYKNMHEIISLVDEPYPCKKNGKVVTGPWFGRLLKSNTVSLFETDLIRINNWFNTITNPNLSIEKKFSLLLNESNNIKGINVGFVTLILYLIDKSNYSIWFEGLHEGYRKIYPGEPKYNGKVDQYVYFNKAAKEFAVRYGFDNTELDWIFSTGVLLFDCFQEADQNIRTSFSKNIYEQIKEVLETKKGQVVNRSDVIRDVQTKFGTNPASIILSDYCYNRINNGIKFNKHIFEYLDVSTYKYLGENFQYTGPIYHKPIGGDSEKIIGEWKDGIKYLKEEVNNWEKLEQRKYTIDEIFERQKTIPEVRELVAEFHQSLGRFLAKRNLNWWARTHVYGCSYFCNRQRYFMAINISSSDFVVHYYTGNSEIAGLEKSTWSEKDDRKGSKPFHIKNTDDIGKALIFAEAAYRITENESFKVD